MPEQTAVAAPNKWDVQIENGPKLAGMSREELLDGLRAGWIILDDQVRYEGGEWKSIRYSLGESDFTFRVYVNPANAFGEKFAPRGAGVGAVVALIAGLSFTYSQVPDLSTSQRAVLTIGSAVLVPLVLGGLMALPKGLLVVGAVVFFGLPLLAAIAGVDPRAISSLLFNFWVWMPLVLGTAAGAAVGAGLGTAVGRGVGRARARAYGLPTSRASPPDWVIQRAAESDFQPAPSVAHVGREIMKLRESVGLTRGQLAARVGVFSGLIAEIENGSSDPSAHFGAIVNVLRQAGADCSQLIAER